MNYHEIFNKVMLELNLRPILQFENIYKNEHLRILENIKRVNCEICTSHDWNFLVREDECTLLKGEIDPGYEVCGRVISVWEDGQKLNYNKNFTEFFTGAAADDSYGVYNAKLVFPKSNKDRDFKLFYSSKFTVIDEDGIERENFMMQSDVSLIPMPYAEDVLVYGACVKTKANPSFAKFPFWNSNYIRAIARLRAECHASREDSPRIRIEKRFND